MGRVKISTNLYLDEYLPTDIWNKFGESAIRLLDPRVIAIDQALRDKFGPIFINMPELFLENRGYRPPSYYIKNPNSQSQHRYGRASDKHFKNVTVDEVYEYILANPAEWISLGLTTIENIEFTRKDKLKTGWLHTDCRMPELAYVGKIRIVNP